MTRTATAIQNRMVGGTPSPNVLAVHGREVAQPVRHGAEDVAAVGGADAGENLSQAGDGKARAEGQDQRLPLQPVGQDAVEEADQRRR